MLVVPGSTARLGALYKAARAYAAAYADQTNPLALRAAATAVLRAARRM